MQVKEQILPQNQSRTSSIMNVKFEDLSDYDDFDGISFYSLNNKRVVLSQAANILVLSLDQSNLKVQASSQQQRQAQHQYLTTNTYW